MAKKVSTKKAETEAQEAPVVLRPDADVAVEKRLVALYTLQSVDSEIDKIKIIRGELPQAVQDLEDEIAGPGFPALLSLCANTMSACG